MNRRLTPQYPPFCFAVIAISTCVLLPISTHPFAFADDQLLPFITASGPHLVDPSGSEVILKGCNLGNYLMLESWMFGGTLNDGPDPGFPDGATFYRTLRQRFGNAPAQHLIDLYRTNWISPRDLQLIKTFGFNVVRLPFDYRLLQDDRPPFPIKEDAFRWLDHTVDMASDAGLYVILDLHGVPGGQSLEQHTGESGQDHLWTSEEDQQRTVAVWKALADHFKNRSAVAAYDLINEPYGNHIEDCRPVLASLLPRIYRAIRSTGDQHVLFFPGALNGGISFYGNPHDHAMTNVGFTEHYYPGLFGSKSALETQARSLNQSIPAKYAYLSEISSPYYVGEFNIVLESEDPCRMLRAYYDRFAQYGWPCTMWSYKNLSARGGAQPDSWYMATNANPLPPLNLQNSSYDDFQNFFAILATMPLATNEPLRDALTTPNPAPLYLATYPPLPTAPPASPPSFDPQGFTSVDLGGASPGYTQALANGNNFLLAGGIDIFASTDSCRFLSQPVQGNSCDFRAAILSFTDSAEFAKAGIMARWGEPNDSRSAMAMVNVFPDGTIALVTRRRAGGRATETKVSAAASLPIELRLHIDHGLATGMYRTDKGDWQTVASAGVPSQNAFRIGLAACAHLDAGLTTVSARLGPSADDALPPPGDSPPAPPPAPSLLTNASFEQQGTAADLAANWNRWGPWLNRETAWTPTHSGSSEIGYHHWQVDSAGTSGLWQNVNVEPGKRYTFSIFAQRDIPHPRQTEAQNIELRLETITDHGPITLNTQDFEVRRLATGNQWTRLKLSGTADGPHMRALIVITPAEDAPRGGAIKLDDATLIKSSG